MWDVGSDILSRIENPASNINNLFRANGHYQYGLVSNRRFRQSPCSEGHECVRWWEDLADENEDRRPRDCKEFQG